MAPGWLFRRINDVLQTEILHLTSSQHDDDGEQIMTGFSIWGAEPRFLNVTLHFPNSTNFVQIKTSQNSILHLTAYACLCAGACACF